MRKKAKIEKTNDDPKKSVRVQNNLTLDKSHRFESRSKITSASHGAEISSNCESFSSFGNSPILHL